MLKAEQLLFNITCMRIECILLYVANHTRITWFTLAEKKSLFPVANLHKITFVYRHKNVCSPRFCQNLRLGNYVGREPTTILSLVACSYITSASVQNICPKPLLDKYTNSQCKIYQLIITDIK